MKRLHLTTVGLSLMLMSALVLPGWAEQTNTSNPKQGTSCQACKHHKKRAGGHHKKHDMFQKLNLSEEQRAQMKKLNENFKQENASLLESLKSKHEQLRALGKDPSKAEERKQLRDSMKQDFQALHNKRTALMKQVLTPEQQQQMEKMREEWKQKRQERMQQKRENSGKQS